MKKKSSLSKIDKTEADRLLNKGKRLFKRYCQKDDLTCVTGFVAHQLKQPNGRSQIVVPFLAYLREQEQRSQVTKLIAAVENQVAASPDSTDHSSSK